MIIGPPRGCDMSPTRRPGQPSSARASAAKRSRKSRSRGLPQLRLRDSRITCQSGPLMGRATPPARQPLAYEPIDRAARGAGVVTEPNSSLAGGPIVSGAFSGLVTALAVTSLTAVSRFGLLGCRGPSHRQRQRQDQNRLSHRASSGSTVSSEPSLNLGDNESRVAFLDYRGQSLSPLRASSRPSVHSSSPLSGCLPIS